jgi:hypothetical protein
VGQNYPREEDFISSEQIERWRLLALEARNYANTNGAATQICFLRIARHWEALIEDFVVERKRANG